MENQIRYTMFLSHERNIMEGKEKSVLSNEKPFYLLAPFEVSDELRPRNDEKGLWDFLSSMRQLLGADSFFRAATAENDMDIAKFGYPAAASKLSPVL
jgi:hypothetical protein